MQTVEQTRALLERIDGELYGAPGSADNRRNMLSEAAAIIRSFMEASLPPSAPVDREAAALSTDMLRALPGGAMDDSTFEAIEEALDRADAPSVSGSRWLTLPERIAALALPPSGPELPDDVRRLVIAAREFWDEMHGPFPESDDLDKALEAFASRVPYANQPEVSHEA